MTTQAQIDTGRSLNRQAVAMGKPTILVEIGQNGSREEADVAAIVTGVGNALSILGISPGSVTPVPPPLRLFESSTSLSAGSSGV
jgi:predicted deacylase